MSLKMGNSSVKRARSSRSGKTRISADEHEILMRSVKWYLNVYKMPNQRLEVIGMTLAQLRRGRMSVEWSCKAVEEYLNKLVLNLYGIKID